ncbi:PTS sugar transporter subunit IIA [uncultured Olegusella sp.]|uniref:PTS sugar transporter subunit IIA n=1 Tax=uncultured Olegusella sp. TaxID=1979846 RepID=UPI00263627C3|nr:PTS sugar transporter subunit IIA [uncultured Olegusella sp.]
MTQTKLLHDNDIYLEVDAATKEELFAFIGACAVAHGVAGDANAVAEDLMERERQMPTGLTSGFAIPHTKSPNIDAVDVLYLRTNAPIAWESMDEEPTQYFFVLLVPEANEGNIHLKLISELATRLLEDDFIDKVKSMQDAHKLAAYINDSIEKQG